MIMIWVTVEYKVHFTFKIYVSSGNIENLLKGGHLQSRVNSSGKAL